AHLQQVEPAMVVEVFGKPVEVDGEAIGVAEVHEREDPKRRAGEDFSPWDRSGGGSSAERAGEYLEFRGVDRGVFRRGVAIVPIPHSGPEESEHSEGHEGGDPAVAR